MCVAIERRLDDLNLAYGQVNVALCAGKNCASVADQFRLLGLAPTTGNPVIEQVPLPARSEHPGNPGDVWVQTGARQGHPA
jgi:hypothetical protein